MGRSNSKGDAVLREPVNLKEAADSLTVAGTKGELRLLDCPHCQRILIREHDEKIAFVDCICGTRVKLKRRWFE